MPIPRLLTRVLAIACVWWIICEGEFGALVFGVPLIALLAWAQLNKRDYPAARLNLRAALPFIGHFLWHSLLGGIDVARRALSPSMPLAPAFVQYSWRVQDRRARLLVAGTMNLLPGTLSSQITDQHLCLHALDTSLPVERNLRALEEQVAALLGSPLGAGAR